MVQHRPYLNPSKGPRPSLHRWFRRPVCPAQHSTVAFSRPVSTVISKKPLNKTKQASKQTNSIPLPSLFSSPPLAGSECQRGEQASWYGAEPWQGLWQWPYGSQAHGSLGFQQDTHLHKQDPKLQATAPVTLHKSLHIHHTAGDEPR